MSEASGLRVDAHAHVYDIARHPFSASRGFELADNEVGTADQLAAVLDAHGFTHALLVNPLGGYGTDNACLLHALRQSKGRFKGVALVADGTPEAEFDRMAQAGVVGLRFNLNFANSPTLAGPGAERTLALARERGWFAQVHSRGDDLVDALPALRRCRLRLVVDHCGRPDTTRGLDQPGFRALLELGREGKAAVKLSSVFRFSRDGFPYREADPFVHALVDAFGIERCLWGSDWPFVRAPHRVDHAGLLVALARWFPNPSDRTRILGANAAQLLGFVAR
ncbi:MAG: amidohydrolase family protein [Rhizobacter sp.]|nr:amidohydrolase family protein [Rhizobacter sp.]